MVLGPVTVFTNDEVKLRSEDLYTSDTINRSFLGMPRGVYMGFVPVIAGLTLTLKTDKAIIYTDVSPGSPSAFTVGTTITGDLSGATAVVRIIRASLPGRGILLVDNIVGGPFTDGEQINVGVATIDQVTAEDVSIARVDTTSTLAGNRTEEATTVIVDADIALDFSPGTIPDGTYYVVVTASYEVGEVSTAQVTTLLATPPDGRFQIGVCSVTKTSGILVLEPINDPTLHVNRHTPYAERPTRFGFMEPGSIADLAAALGTVQEVVAARTGSDGAAHTTFSIPQSQTSGLPLRLKTDLGRAGTGDRLGKELITIQGNDYELSIPSSNTVNVSGSFASKVRDQQPFKDVTNGILPTGIDVPILINSDGIEGITLAASGVTGTFAVGEDLTGATSGATGVIRNVSGSLINVSELTGSFFVGEVINSVGPPTASATITAIDQREGTITAPETGVGGDPERNLVTILDTFEGKHPTNASGNQIYGRLLFGPDGPTATSGGQSGKLLIATNNEEQINFTNGSTAVTSNNIDFTEYLLPGDILQGDDGRYYEVSHTSGSVQTGAVLLTTGKPYVGPNASSGLDATGANVGSGPRQRLRYLLKFVSLSGGIEIDENIVDGSVPLGSSIRPFFPGWFSRKSSNYNAVIRLRAAGDGHRLQDQGSTVPSLGHNASASSPQIGEIKTIQIGGIPAATDFHTINYQTGQSGQSLSQSATGEITINAPGPPGPAGPSGGGPAGSIGPTGPGFQTIETQTTLHLTGATPGSHTFPFSAPIRFYTVHMAIEGSGWPFLNTGYIESVVTPDFNVGTSVLVNYVLNAGTPISLFCSGATA